MIETYDAERNVVLLSEIGIVSALAPEISVLWNRAPVSVSGTLGVRVVDDNPSGFFSVFHQNQLHRVECRHVIPWHVNEAQPVLRVVRLEMERMRANPDP